MASKKIQDTDFLLDSFDLRAAADAVDKLNIAGEFNGNLVVRNVSLTVAFDTEGGTHLVTQIEPLATE